MKNPDQKIIPNQVEEFSQEIQQMRDKDQSARTKVIELEERNEDASEAWEAVKEVDRNNTARMKEIIREIGLPIISKVGKKVYQMAWLLAQHADDDIEFQKYYLELMKKAKSGDVLNEDIAYLEDRILRNEDKPQIYGTQLENNGEPQPMEDPEHVDERREKMGLDPLAKYIEEFRKVYNVKK